MTLQEQIDELRERLDRLVISIIPGDYPVQLVNYDTGEASDVILRILPWKDEDGEA